MKSSLYESYCVGSAREFLRHHYTDAQARNRAVERAVRPLAPDVADAIEDLNRRFPPSRAREENLNRLRCGAAAVVTGQQVGLFLGPLYNFYKAASAIRAAREMAATSGAAVVPVFWLQTEDHDLPEIAANHVPRADGTSLRLDLPASAEDRVSLAHLTLPPEVDDKLDHLRDELANLPHAKEHLQRLARHYRPGARWCDAFAGVLAELFADQGLVLLDPRVPSLGPMAAAIHRTAIERAEPIADALLARSAAIEEFGSTPTVHVRPGAPLSFYHPSGPTGPRYRLEPSKDGWSEVGGENSHTTDELLAVLDREPLSCSTSVLLRPILQDTLLPTAAYVGGAGEVSYFAQLSPLYEAYGIDMPMILPRASFRLVEQKTQRLLNLLGATPECAQLSEDEILTNAATARGETSANNIQSRLIDSFAAALRNESKELTDAGPGMATNVEKAQRSVEHAIERLVSKYRHAQRHRHEDLLEAARRIKRLLMPESMPQERFFGFSYFAARYGERELLDRILAAVEPFDPEMRNLSCADAREES